LSGHPVQQRQEKLLILSGRVRKNAAEQQLGQFVSCQRQEKLLILSGRGRKNAAE
jgi:hypothetical protein